MRGGHSIPYVLVGPDGVHYIGLHETEDAAWDIALGWPSQKEINNKKESGFEMLPATLSYKRKTAGA